MEEVPCQYANVSHPGILPAVTSPGKNRWRLPQPSERPTLGLWVLALGAYIGLGIWQPPVFLLGFQESLLFVFVATLVIGRIANRRK